MLDSSGYVVLQDGYSKKEGNGGRQVDSNRLTDLMKGLGVLS